MRRPKQPTQSWFEIRPSTIHGQGAFALQFIPRGACIIEYTGERITPQEADVRYNDEAMEYPHTFLFTVDKRTVIDAAHDGNESRYINHSCEPNCQTFIEDGRVYIEAIRDIPPGAELTYDYHLTRSGRYGAKWERRYACHCGAPSCRGTLLAQPRRKAWWKKAR